MRNYKNIKAWEYSDNLTILIYRHTRGFPREELYGLTSQLRRSAYSVPANIAEGSSRNSKRDYLHFLYIARGSLSETEYLCHLAARLGYVKEDVYSEITQQLNATFARLHGLIHAVEKESGAFGRKAAAVTSTLVLVCLKVVHHVGVTA
ncbi:MAG: four helix bundle protein [Kiritimatiellae bacterium]|nr:four helix bundle protein [Kiritimatiellia bacterium]